MVCLQLAQDAEGADWCEDATILPGPVLLGDRRVTMITLHGAERHHPLRHTCNHSLRNVRLRGFKATRPGEISGQNTCTERQRNICLRVYAVKSNKQEFGEVIVSGSGNHMYRILLSQHLL